MNGLDGRRTEPLPRPQNVQAVRGAPTRDFFEVEKDPAVFDRIATNLALWSNTGTAAPPGFINRRISDRNPRGPFTGCVNIYPRDTYVRFKLLNPASRPGGGLRGRVLGFSARSRRNAIKTLRNKSPEVRWVAFITLTYPQEYPNPEQVKRDLSKWLKRLRRRFPGIAYYWVMELQQRGALHFHILVDRFVPKDWLSRSWFEAVASGDEKHLLAGTSVEGVRNRNKVESYLLGKYLNKEAQKSFEGWTGRVWGCSRGLLATPEKIHLGGSFRDMARALRPLRRFVKSRHRPWRWKGGGFTVYNITATGVERLLEAGIASVLH